MLARMNTTRLLYAPEAYAASQPAEIVRQYPFALLVTQSPAGILATHTPIFFETDESESTLVGHIARNNPQAAALEAGQSALAIFAGPHAYISSSWYRERLAVPTWNYVSAHVRGTLEPIDNAKCGLKVLQRTAVVLERNNQPSWTLEDAPPGRVDFLLPMIRAFRITIERIEGVTKLSQTHPAGDQQRIVRRLLERNGEGDAAIARLMARCLIPN
jgi:transcriptional regulator